MIYRCSVTYPPTSLDPRQQQPPEALSLTSRRQRSHLSQIPGLPSVSRRYILNSDNYNSARYPQPLDKISPSTAPHGQIIQANTPFRREQVAVAQSLPLKVTCAMYQHKTTSADHVRRPTLPRRIQRRPRQRPAGAKHRQPRRRDLPRTSSQGLPPEPRTRDPEDRDNLDGLIALIFDTLLCLRTAQSGVEKTTRRGSSHMHREKIPRLRPIIGPSSVCTHTVLCIIDSV